MRILTTILILTISSLVVTAATTELCSTPEPNASSAKAMKWPYYITISASNTTICSGQCITISATVTSGHNAPYTFTWTGGGIPNTNAGTGTYTIGPYTVCPTTTTTYTVSVTDAYNWAPATASVTITVQPPTPLNLSTSSVDATCGNADGTATVTASGGTTPYTYQWGPSANNQTTQTATGLGAGSYDVTVTDNSGCSVGTTQVTVVSGGSITALLNGTTDPSCSGDSNGTATVIAGGGTQPYTYAWGPTGGNGATGTGLAGGITYTVTVTENNGCSTTQSVMLTDPAPVIALIGASTDPPCTGGTGDATVGVSGGTTAYTYAWSPTGGIGATGTGISAGVMTTVLVTDANGCTANDSILLTEPPMLLATVISNTPPTCTGGNDGTATAVAAGGTGSYTYVWTPAGGNGPTGTGLSAGTTTLYVSDANGCIASDSVTLVDPPAILVSIDSSTDPTCFGGNNGTATGSAAGGTGTYSYSWSPSGGTGATGTGLSAGVTYNIIVTDGNGCSGTDAVILSDPPSLSSTIISTINPGCIGSSDGEATVGVSGGTPPYSYLWAHNGGTSATGTGMSSGINYVVTVTDSNNCTIIDSVVLGQNIPMIVTTTGSNICFGSSTDLEVTVQGGLAPYSYLWDNASIGSSQTVSPTGLTTYSVTITDSLGCLAFDTITIAVSTPLTVTDSAVTICEGDAITIYTQVTGGSGVRAYLWDDGSTTTAISVSPSTNTSYSVTVTDTCGSATATIDITTIEPPFVDFSMGCDPNPHGLQFTNSSDPLAGSTFTWDFGDAASSTDQDPSHDYVSTGLYPVQLTVTTVDGCTNDTTITVTAPPDAAFIANPTEASTDDPEVHFTDWSVDPNNIVYWVWDFGDSTGVDNLLGQAGNDNVPSDTATGGTFQNPSHIYSDTGLFIVQLTVHDANGCLDTITQEIRIFSEYFLYAPSAFTPNYDGNNDIFLPSGLGITERDYELAVYNRWGDRIFESDDISVGWDGTANGGGVVQSDVYIWTLSTRDIRLKIHQYIGHVTLYR